MEDNKKFKADGQNVKELIERFEEGMEQMDTLRSSMEAVLRTVRDLAEGMEDAMQGLQEEREPDRQKEDEEEKTYQEVEVFGVPALFDNARIPQEDVPEGLHRYDLRGSGDNPGEPVTVELQVVVNHAASILTPVPLPVPKDGFLRIGEELNFVGGMMAAREFMERYSGMNVDSLMENMEDAICHENEELILKPSEEYGRYAIYRINEDIVKDNYLFMNLEQVKNKGIEVRGEDYSLVYGGKLSGDVTLEMLYEKFNIDHPEGFRGHSLSVSDVVVTNRGGEVKAFYVDSFGYAELLEFVKQRQNMMEQAAEDQLEGLTVKGHFGTWHSIDSVELEGERFFLMESDEYGSTVAHIAVDGEGEPVAEDLEKGFDAGFYEAVAGYFREKGIDYGQEAEMPSENNQQRADSAKHPAFYPYSAGYAAEHGEQEMFMASHNLNIACKKAIEEALKENFDGMRLNPVALRDVLDEYSEERIACVLSATLQHQAWDGRYFGSNREWAGQTCIPDNIVMGRDFNCELALYSHPVLIDGFIDLFRKELRQREKAAALETVQDGGNLPANMPDEDMAEDNGDEIIDLGDEREQVLAEMKKSLQGGQETELAFQIADRFISIQETEGGYDYSIMGADCKEIDGGVYDNPDVSIREALNGIVEDLKENSFASGARGNIRDSDGLTPIDYEELMEKAEAADCIKPQAQGDAVTYFKAKTEERFHSISDMNPSEIEETVKCHVQEKIDESGMDAAIVDVAIAGSRCRGLEKEGSDLDVVVELITGEREDVLFDTFNGHALHIGGVKVDINPITAQKTGTLETYLRQAEEYLEELRKLRENEPVSLFNIRMNGGEWRYRNTSGLDVKGLCRAYAECGNPYTDMGKFGERMEAAEYADIEQGERLGFSIEFNGETDKITIFDGENFVCGGMREMLFIQRMEDEPDAAVQLAVKIDCLSHDCDDALYRENVEGMKENVSEIAGAIRQGDTGYLAEWLADLIDGGAVPGKMERAVRLLKELNDYKPIVQTPEMEEQNCSIEYNMPNNDEGENVGKMEIPFGNTMTSHGANKENKNPQTKAAGRVSLKERLAQKQSIVSGRGNERQEVKEKRERL